MFEDLEKRLTNEDLRDYLIENGLVLDLRCMGLNMRKLEQKLCDAIYSVKDEIKKDQSRSGYLGYMHLNPSHYFIAKLHEKILADGVYLWGRDVIVIDLFDVIMEDQETLKNMVIHEESHRIDFLLNKPDIKTFGGPTSHGKNWFKIYSGLGGKTKDPRGMALYGPGSLYWKELYKSD